MNIYFKAVFLTGLALSASACSVTSEVENPILMHSENTKALGNAWKEGRDMVDEGNGLIEKGRSQIEEGEDNLGRGQDMVEQGEAQMRASEAEFEKIVNQGKPVSD